MRKNNTFGFHVHVGVRGADRAIAVVNGLRGLLPELLAVSASSPFAESVDTGLHSVRTQIFTRFFPRCGVPDAFASWAEYESFVRARTPALLRSAYLLTGDQHLAEDLVQEALARTHRAWSRLHDSGNIEAYTRKVMYHTQVSRWRRRRRSRPGSGGRGRCRCPWCTPPRRCTS